MESLKILGLILVVVILLGIGPLITIWTLNTLFFAGSIAYSLKTWFAMLLLHGTLTGIIKAGVN
jgi:hypothetical protein